MTHLQIEQETGQESVDADELGDGSKFVVEGLAGESLGEMDVVDLVGEVVGVYAEAGCR